MKSILPAAVAIFVAAFGYATSAQQSTVDGPRFTAANELIRPLDFREWIFVTSGLGMTYSEPSSAARTPNFTNVYVNPSSYRSFMKTGRWPDKTIFILEVRTSASEGSINKGGHFQSDLRVIEASVKDEARYPGKWAYFDFGRDMKDRVEALPTTASCYSCHAEKGAVDNTFVQFYPTLLEVARKMGTDEVATLIRRGDAFRKTNQHDRAIHEYDEAIKLSPKEALAYFNRGLTYEALGHDNNALQDFSAAVRLNPKLSAAFERRATVYFRMGLYDRAQSDYTAAVSIDPKNAAALYGRGVTQRMDRFNPASTAEADIAAAKAVQADIADDMSARGVK